MCAADPIEFTAVGQLVLRLKGEELRLTAIAAKGQPRLVRLFQGPDKRLDDRTRLPHSEAAGRQRWRVDRHRFQLRLQSAVNLLQFRHVPVAAT